MKFVKDHPVIMYMSLAVVAFVGGIGADRYILERAMLDTVPRGSYLPKEELARDYVSKTTHDSLDAKYTRLRGQYSNQISKSNQIKNLVTKLDTLIREAEKDLVAQTPYEHYSSWRLKSLQVLALIDSMKKTDYHKQLERVMTLKDLGNSYMVGEFMEADNFQDGLEHGIAVLQGVKLALQ